MAVSSKDVGDLPSCVRRRPGGSSAGVCGTRVGVYAVEPDSSARSFSIVNSGMNDARRDLTET
jgi:hypothetical protein